MSKVATMSTMNGDRVNFPKGTLKGVPGQDFVRKSDLIDGEYYYGHCRNAKCAKWVASRNEFVYIRTKFGSRFSEGINHPEDDNGFDLFVPYFRCYPEEQELVAEDSNETD